MLLKRLRHWLLVILVLLLSLGALWQVWPQPRAALYRFMRAEGRERTLDRLEGYGRRQSDRFDLYYMEADEDQTDLILEIAEEVYDQVIEQVGYQPPGRVPLILYPTRQELRKAFGWGSDESALGVYWQGSIRLLSPHAWIDEESSERLAEAFRQLNPITHELTHYVLDSMTDGNYPRWFTEGLAQVVEERVTGYLWLEPSSTLDQELYTLTDLQERFDRLSNQPLAYRQSYLLIAYLLEQYGEEGLGGLIHQLAEGTPFARAVELRFGLSMPQLFDDWQHWAVENRDRLDETAS